MKKLKKFRTAMFPSSISYPKAPINVALSVRPCVSKQKIENNWTAVRCEVMAVLTVMCHGAVSMRWQMPTFRRSILYSTLKMETVCFPESLEATEDLRYARTQKNFINWTSFFFWNLIWTCAPCKGLFWFRVPARTEALIAGAFVRFFRAFWTRDNPCSFSQSFYDLTL
jgi:hypothetical protein